MKIKVSKKEVVESFKNIICIGYCDLQSLLSYIDADYYTSGVYGWNADIYKINNNTVIVTGYRPFGNIRNYDLVRKYEKKAEKIKYDYDIDYKTKIRKAEKPGLTACRGQP